MYYPLFIIIIIVFILFSIAAAIWFNYSIHSEIRRRLNIQNNRRVMPVTYAVEVDNITENVDIYVVYPEQIITV
jgi:flagellar basal body-associated protein FliL